MPLDIQAIARDIAAAHVGDLARITSRAIETSEARWVIVAGAPGIAGDLVDVTYWAQCRAVECDATLVDLLAVAHDMYARRLDDTSRPEIASRLREIAERVDLGTS